MAMPCLEPGHYRGISKERSLLRAGLEQELTLELRWERRPRLLREGRFRPRRFRQPVDVAIAQSLFTHLPPRLIALHLARRQMETFGREQDDVPECIRAWHHPRGQVMVTFRPAP